MENVINKNFSGLSKNLLNRLQTKELTLPEFLRECAYWALKDGFDELAPLDFPTLPATPAFNEYNNLPPDRRAKLDAEFFHKNPEIISWGQQVCFVRNRNNANIHWLEEIKNYLPADDFLMLQKVDGRILEFKTFVDENPLMIEKIKNVFQAKVVNPKPRNYYTAGEAFSASEVY